MQRRLQETAPRHPQPARLDSTAQHCCVVKHHRIDCVPSSSAPRCSTPACLDCSKALWLCPSRVVLRSLCPFILCPLPPPPHTYLPACLVQNMQTTCPGRSWIRGTITSGCGAASSLTDTFPTNTTRLLTFDNLSSYQHDETSNVVIISFPQTRRDFQRCDSQLPTNTTRLPTLSEFKFLPTRRDFQRCDNFLSSYQHDETSNVVITF